jgi:hypothetical protein
MLGARGSLSVWLGAFLGCAAGIGCAVVALALVLFGREWLAPRPDRPSQDASSARSLHLVVSLMPFAIIGIPLGAVVGGILGASRAVMRPAPSPAGPDEWIVPGAGQVADVINHLHAGSEPDSGGENGEKTGQQKSGT